LWVLLGIGGISVHSRLRQYEPRKKYFIMQPPCGLF